MMISRLRAVGTKVGLISGMRCLCRLGDESALNRDIGREVGLSLTALSRSQVLNHRWLGKCK
jgi:hypothetical protein